MGYQDAFQNVSAALAPMMQQAMLNRARRERQEEQEREMAFRSTEAERERQFRASESEKDRAARAKEGGANRAAEAELRVMGIVAQAHQAELDREFRKKENYYAFLRQLGMEQARATNETQRALLQHALQAADWSIKHESMSFEKLKDEAVELGISVEKADTSETLRAKLARFKSDLDKKAADAIRKMGAARDAAEQEIAEIQKTFNEKDLDRAKKIEETALRAAVAAVPNMPANAATDEELRKTYLENHPKEAKTFQAEYEAAIQNAVKNSGKERMSLDVIAAAGRLNGLRKQVDEWNSVASRLLESPNTTAGKYEALQEYLNKPVGTGKSGNQPKPGPSQIPTRQDVIKSLSGLRPKVTPMNQVESGEEPDSGKAFGAGVPGGRWKNWGDFASEPEPENGSNSGWPVATPEADQVFRRLALQGGGFNRVVMPPPANGGAAPSAEMTQALGTQTEDIGKLLNQFGITEQQYLDSKQRVAKLMQDIGVGSEEDAAKAGEWFQKKFGQPPPYEIIAAASNGDRRARDILAKLVQEYIKDTAAPKL